MYGVGCRSSSGVLGGVVTLPRHKRLDPSPLSLAGAGCSGRDGGDSFTGKEACCGGGVSELGRICSSSVGAPCIISDGRRFWFRAESETGFHNLSTEDRLFCFSMSVPPPSLFSSYIPLTARVSRHVWLLGDSACWKTAVSLTILTCASQKQTPPSCRWSLVRPSLFVWCYPRNACVVNADGHAVGPTDPPAPTPAPVTNGEPLHDFVEPSIARVDTGP